MRFFQVSGWSNKAFKCQKYFSVIEISALLSVIAAWLSLLMNAYAIHSAVHQHFVRNGVVCLSARQQIVKAATIVLKQDIMGSSKHLFRTTEQMTVTWLFDFESNDPENPNTGYGPSHSRSHIFYVFVSCVVQGYDLLFEPSWCLMTWCHGITPFLNYLRPIQAECKVKLQFASRW